MSKKARIFRFPVTLVTLIIAIIVSSAAMAWNIDLFELPFGLMARFELREIDEVISSLFLVVVAFIFDQMTLARRAKRDAALDNERVRVVHVTMRTVQDIVNNCLNQLQLLRLAAEDHGVPPESVVFFDHAIRETSAKLKVLGDLRTFAEKQLAIGAPGLDDGSRTSNLTTS